MDWDADNYIPPVPATITNKWDGEDEEENVKDNWEDDDEEKKREERVKKQSSQQSKKPLSKLALKVEEREKKEMEKRARQNILASEDEIDTTNMTPEQIFAEKQRRERIQKEADLELAKEMMGVTDADLLDKMSPKTKDDFCLLKDALCKQILLFKNSEHFSTFIEEFFRDLSAGLSVNDVKKIKLNLENMFNEKVRVEKAKKGKSKGRAKLKMENNEMSTYDEYSAYTIDDYDDFM